MDFLISREARISVENSAFAVSDAALPTQRLKLEVANVAGARAICLSINQIITEYTWESVISNLIDSHFILVSSSRAPPVRI